MLAFDPDAAMPRLLTVMSRCNIMNETPLELLNCTIGDAAQEHWCQRR